MDIVHLVKRTIESAGSRPPDPVDMQWACLHLSPAERELWAQLHTRDQRHSINVARRFSALAGDPPTTAIAGALLHDIGKIDATSSILLRIMSTIVGPRTRMFRRLHEHEVRGRDLLLCIGSASATIETAAGEGVWGETLRRADHL